VRRNALKHGLTAEMLVVDGEDADAFRIMADAHLACFQPRNAVEVEFARTFTMAAWRRLRCVSTETAMVNQRIRVAPVEHDLTITQHVMALGRQLFFDSQDLWQLFPDPLMGIRPIFKRKEKLDGPVRPPSQLVNELESPTRAAAGCSTAGTS
jgi:hypothetical protein